MKEKKKHLLEIMQIELQDLRDDFEALMEQNKKRFHNKDISKHVYLENETLYKNELLGVEEFFNILIATDPSQYDNLDSMICQLQSQLQNTIKTEGLAPAVKICIDRKLVKVKKYVLQ